MSKDVQILRDDAATSIWRSTEVAACKECKGQGRKLIYVGGNRDNTHDWERCKICAGFGMVTKKLVVNIYPFDNKKEV